MDQKKIGALIAMIRKEKGYTQRELADCLEVSEKTISKWECGNGMPEVSLMMPLCRVLGLTVNELLSGERMPFLEMVKKMEDTMMNMAKELETEQLKQRVYKLYGIEIDTVEMSEFGAGSLTYIVCAGSKKYVIKYASENGMNHPELEQELCDYLLAKDIPVCRFVANKQGAYLSTDENGRLFHVQEFIEGKTYEYHEAPGWLMKQSAIMLGRIHSSLKEYKVLPEGIGSNFFLYRTPEATLDSYQKMLIQTKGLDDKMVSEIKENMEQIKKYTRASFDLSKLTCENTHGDYNITQLLCGAETINAVIDWTTACVHPVIWEIMRSYVYASPRCKEGKIDIADFTEYVKTYLEYAPLNTYDLENMGKLYYDTLIVSNFYGQYDTAMTRNREIYLKQAQLSNKLMKWFSLHLDELTQAMLTLQ